MTILVATGLQREARLFQGPGVVVIAGGGQSEMLEAALVAAAASASGIISLGIAGALAEGLSSGDWVVAEAVIAGKERFHTDPAWRGRLLRRLPQAMQGAFLGSDAMLTRAAEKHQARRTTNAIAVDMESHIAARVAQRFALPFAAARVISDSADRDLPPAVLVGMRPDGGTALKPVLAALAGDPRQLPALIRTGLDAERAFRALARIGSAWMPAAG